MSKEIEIWKNVPSFPGYQASNFGRIRTVDRPIHIINRHGRTGKEFNQTLNLKGKVKKLKTTKFGYFRVNCSGVKVFAHRLVWEAFNFKLNSNQFLNHKNGIKTDNSLENLEVCTKKENALHAIVTLKRVINQSGKRALDEQSVRTIRFFTTRGNYALIGKIFNIPPGCVSKIIKGITYTCYPFTEEEKEYCKKLSRGKRNGIQTVQI